LGTDSFTIRRGCRSKTLLEFEEQKKTDDEMQAKIKAAMEAAFAAEKKRADDEKKKQEAERKRLEDQQRQQAAQQQAIRLGMRCDHEVLLQLGVASCFAARRDMGRQHFHAVAEKPVVYVYTAQPEQGVTVSLKFDSRSQRWSEPTVCCPLFRAQLFALPGNLVSYPKLAPAQFEQVRLSDCAVHHLPFASCRNLRVNRMSTAGWSTRASRASWSTAPVAALCSRSSTRLSRIL
jgi:hypothetical protein